VYNYLKSFAKLEGHYVVENGVDCSGEVVKYARDVSHNSVNVDYKWLVGDVELVGPVDRHEPLGVERRPTDEERHNYSS